MRGRERGREKNGRRERERERGELHHPALDQECAGGARGTLREHGVGSRVDPLGRDVHHVPQRQPRGRLEGRTLRTRGYQYIRIIY